MACVTLKQLCVQHNQLSGNIPNTISHLTSLEILYAHHNQLSGHIPEEITLLSESLRLLNLSFNQLTHLIPLNIGKLQKLEVLVLHGNQITGPAPISLKHLHSLKDFACFGSYPSLSFEIPRAFDIHKFHRIYVDGPNMQLDSAHWNSCELYGDKVPTELASVPASAWVYQEAQHNMGFQLKPYSEARNIKYTS